MKSTFLTLIMLLIFSISQAQVELGVTVGAQIPTGDLSNGTKTGFGLMLLVNTLYKRISPWV